MMLEVVGGTYVERCHFPEWNEVYGSGLRAAAVARALGSKVRFHTCICDSQRPALLARCYDLEIDCFHHAVNETHCFEYVHGLSTPIIHPLPPVTAAQRSATVEVDGDTLVVFGMLEANVCVKGRRVVYDPQNPHEPERFDSTGSVAESLAIICNLTEGRKLTGRTNPNEIAVQLAQSPGCDVAVLKCGSWGAIVSAEGATERVPAFETETVWPIGSGDVFAAAFAVHWSAEGLDAIDAARRASLHTAHYCETRLLITPKSCERKEIHWIDTKSRQVYLAGPFFSMAQIWLINESCNALRSQGFKVFSPLHHVGRGSAKDIYEPDIKGIEDCDLMFACIDGLDAGTLFEVGYAKALGKPVVAFVQNEKEEDLKMLEGSDCFLERDFVTAIYRTSWLGNV